MKSVEELNDILEVIREKVFIANRMGELDNLLIDWKITTSSLQKDYYDTYKDGKIVVIGAPTVKEKDLISIIKNYKLDIKRFEFCLDYDKSKTYNYKKLQFEPKYRLVIFGAVPHSSTGKLSSGNVVSQMKTVAGYPRVEALYNGSELKITKSNFKELLEKLIKENYI